jgi:hypothetical protein
MKKTGQKGLAIAAIALGAMIYLGPLAALSLDALGTMKTWARPADSCVGPAATRCLTGVPSYPAADLVVIAPADAFVRP